MQKVVDIKCCEKSFSKKLPALKVARIHSGVEFSQIFDKQAGKRIGWNLNNLAKIESV